MSNLKKEYDELIELRKNIIEEIKVLEENEIVKKHLEIKKQNENLYEKQLDLYKKIKYEEYESCKHILVYTEIDYDKYEGRTYRSYGCIKCGLDNSILKQERKWLTFPQMIMHDYLKEKYLNGSKTKIACDLELAQAIYSKIKEENPDIDDETAIRYFEIALDNIRSIKVSDERKINRAKRLSLEPSFKKWNSSDIHN